MASTTLVVVGLGWATGATFLSSTSLPESLLTTWIRDIAPLHRPATTRSDWAAKAGRDVTGAHTACGTIGSYIGLLLLAVAVSGWLSTRAFEAF
jgi:hypothetical protein